MTDMTTFRSMGGTKSRCPSGENEESGYQSLPERIQRTSFHKGIKDMDVAEKEEKEKTMTRRVKDRGSSGTGK